VSNNEVLISIDESVKSVRDEWNVVFLFVFQPLSWYLGKFRIQLSFVMGGHCCDVPCSVTHPIYSWFGRECGGCGPHMQGKMGQKCASF